jgi:hypothetical protein
MAKDVLDWSRKIHKCQLPEDVVRVIQSMKPPDAFLHSNCSHEAYIVCLSLAAIRYTELLAALEDAEAQTI